MKKVLITGGTGFIGRHIIPHLLARGYEVHITTSLPVSKARTPTPLPQVGKGISSSQSPFTLSPLPLAEEEQEVKVYHTNLLDPISYQPLIAQIHPTHLLHTAWYTQNKKFWDAIENIHWLKATLSLVETFLEAGGDRVLGLGTCAEYDWTYGLCTENVTLEIPTNLYGKVKKSTFECLTALVNAYSKSFCWARIFFPYGPHEAESRLIPYVITQLLRNNEARCTHGNQIRDFMHVNDIANALAATLDSEIVGTINIGSGKPITIREIVNSIAHALDKQNLVNFGAIPEPAHSPRMILANIDRLKNEVGWVPDLTLDEGLSNTIAWWRHIESTTQTKREASK